MKKLIFILILVLPLLLGQTIVRQNPVTVEWDQVLPMGDDIISYDIFVAPIGDYASAQLMGTTDLLEMEVTFPDEGDWVVGVRTVRTIISNGEVLYSDINWSDQNGESTPNPFTARWFIVPGAPSNFRIR